MSVKLSVHVDDDSDNDGDNEATRVERLRTEHHGSDHREHPTLFHQIKGRRLHTPLIALITVVILLYFASGVIIYEMLPENTSKKAIDSYENGFSELTANILMIALSIWIYWKYIGRRIGSFVHTNDCTNFDLFAVLSLLWLITVTFAYLIHHEYGLFLLNLSRCVAIIMPGFVHKYYIRFKADQVTYLGDVKLYKLATTFFFAVQLLSNVVAVPLNAAWFQESITYIFGLGSDTSDEYHLSFIISAVFGRPFLSILLFHSIILYVNWLLNGDKPRSYHNLDLFALSLGSDDNNTNVLLAAVVVTLLILDVLLHPYTVYDVLYLLVYMASSLALFAFVIKHCFDKRMSRDSMDEDDRDEEEHDANHKHHGKGTHVDLCEIFESLFTLLAGLTASICYLIHMYVQTHDIKSDFDAFVKLYSFSLLMVCQYIFIMYFQFVPGRINVKTLHLSGLFSAVTIMYLFLFEYDHFVHMLKADDTEHSSSSDYSYAEDSLTDTYDAAHLHSYAAVAYSHGTTLSAYHAEEHLADTTYSFISYSLFWCMMEYFIWSFVTINHMVHHHLEQQPPTLQRRKMSHKQTLDERRGTLLFVQSQGSRTPRSEHEMVINSLAFTSPNAAGANGHTHKYM